MISILYPVEILGLVEVDMRPHSGVFYPDGFKYLPARFLRRLLLGDSELSHWGGLLDTSPGAVYSVCFAYYVLLLFWTN